MAGRTGQNTPSVADLSPAAKEQVRAGVLKAPLAFVANTGALDPRVAFWLPGSQASVYLTDAGLTYRLSKSDGPGWVVRQDFVGAAATRPVALEKAPTVVSLFKGRPEEWKTAVPTASSVGYRSLWPGVDATYAGTGERLKYEFTVAPGTDPSAVRLSYAGATSVTLTSGGDLRVNTPAGGFTDAAPTAYQMVDGRQVPVTVSYDLADPEPDGPQPYGFALGPYDPSRPLVIDPATIVYAGFIGGGGNDEGQGIAVDSAGAAYVTGSTSSTEALFPETVGPDLTNAGGTNDAFVAKVAPGGASLVYAGFIGGTGNDVGVAIAVDAAGAAYVTGATDSTQATSFPVTGGPDLTHNGNFDAFVAKVAPGGASLSYSGFIGGGGTDQGLGIAVDTTGAAYVTGVTGSTATSFPEVGGPDLTENGGDDAFVAKVAAGGGSLVYAGFIGGDGTDLGRGIAVDATGAAYIAGTTGSSEATFPETGGPGLTFSGGSFDAFVAKVAPGGALVYAGYIGGSGVDEGNGIAVDAAGAAYVVGTTGSSEATFPETGGPILFFSGGTSDAFVAKVAPDGATLPYATYLGGGAADQGYGIAVDAAGAAYVVGSTNSTEGLGNFPVGEGPDITQNGGRDAFVAKVAANAFNLAYAGFIGGAGTDEGYGIALDARGSAYVTGSTNSTEGTFPDAVGPDVVANGGVDAFVAKVASPLPSLPAVARTSTTWIRRNLAGGGANISTFTSTQGTRPLVPMFGDWDGNGSKTPATYEAGTVKLRNDYLGGTHTSSFATGFDVRGFAVAGDFNGDGTDDVAVFRLGTWQIRLSTGTVLPSFTFGTGSWPTTVPVAGDWDGNGTDGIGTYDLATGTWSLRNTADAGAPDAGAFVFWEGTNASYPVVGDWDANGSDTVGVKSGTLWSLRNTNAGGLSDIAFNFGLSTDLPLSWR